MDVTRYVRLLKRTWLLLVLGAAIGAMLGWVTTPEAEAAPATAPPQTYYRARHLLLSTTIPDKDSTALQRAAFLAKRGEVPQRVEARFGQPISYNQVHVRANETIGYIEITVVEDTAADAELLAEVYSEELVAYLARQVAGDAETPFSAVQLVTIERAEATSISEQAYLSFLASPALQGEPQRSGQGSNSSRNQQAQSDEPPPVVAAPEDPDPVARAGVGGAVGLLVGLGLILSIDRLDNRIRTKEDAEAAFGLPVLAEIPAGGRLRRSKLVAAYGKPASSEAEAYRVLRSHLLVASAPAQSNGHGRHRDSETDASVVLITSPGPEQGKTTTTANLAAVLAESGRSVLVVECDFRRPRMEELLGASKGLSLGDLAGQPHEADVDELVRATGLFHVALVTSAPRGGPVTNPADMVARQRALIEIARNRFDVVLLDSAPMLAMSDTSDLLPVCDTMLLTALAGRTTDSEARRGAELSARLEAPAAGVVLVGAEGALSMPRTYVVPRPEATKRTTRRKRRQSVSHEKPAATVTSSPRSKR